MERIRCFAVSIVAAMVGSASGQPTEPVYTETAADCTTADNRVTNADGEFRWFVDPGCDIYAIDLYERPTTQEYQEVGDFYGAKEAFEYLDIVRARHGFDSRFFYVAIELFGRDHLTPDGGSDERGMIERYGFRFSTNPDGRNGLLVVADQPEVKNEPNTEYGPLGTFAYRDTDGDVGGADRDGPTGLEVSKSENPDEADGLNGYDSVVVSDGRTDDETVVVWVRLSPTNDRVVEFAIDYRALGYSTQYMETLRYLDFETMKGGPKDPQNYLWNDRYTQEEAGSPNEGEGGLSEFGTVGLENIYECDTVRADLAACPPDLDGNGVVDTRDLLVFLNAWATQAPVADWDGNQMIDTRDLLAYLNDWSDGCP